MNESAAQTPELVKLAARAMLNDPESISADLVQAWKALKTENERLRSSLRRIEHWPFDVGHTPERDLREIKEAAHDALA